MKAGKNFRLGLGLLLVAGLSAAAPATVIAQEVMDSNEVLMTTQSAQAQAKTTLTERLAERKAALTTKLTTAQTTRLAARCAAAQTKIATHAQGIDTSVAKRAEAYEKIQTKLAGLVDKLEDKVDTDELEAALAVLDQKISDFTAAGATYRQTLADLGELECTDDATGFRASLDSAKTEHTAVVAAAKAVRAQVQDVIKPLLQAIRTELAAEGAE